jgi:uncharacterized protein YjdB
MKKIYFSLIVVCLSLLSLSALAQTSTFSYTGAVQTYDVPAGVSQIGVDMYGGAGGWPCCSWSSSSSAGPRALGGRVQCTLNVTPSSQLYVYVGGQGTDNLNSGTQCPGGWNGGGVGGASGSAFCAGGGGETDIRTSTTGAYATSVIAVAGAGGGGGDFSPVGGAGGGTTGGTGQTVSLSTSGGACGGGQTGPSCTTGSGLGTQGQGGTCTCYSEGGGGAGWWGGNGGTAGDGAGGGGSSYPAAPNSVVTAIVHTQGYSGATSNGQAVITVLCNNPGVIAGAAPSCIGGTGILADPTAGGGAGSWISSNPAVATVNASTGLVTGITAGTAVITYSISSPCGSLATTTVTINPNASPISGSGVACTGVTTTLTETGTGTWTTANGAIATVSSTGVVTGVSAGTTSIIYTLSTGCVPASLTVTVNPNPAPISGSSPICGSTTTSFSDATSSGTWSSSNTTVATINPSTGSVIAMTAGTTTLAYTLSTGCTVTMPVSVSPAPSPIFGAPAICVGATATLTNSTPGGGIWSSSDPGEASVNPGTGLVTGLSTGTPNIYFTSLVTGCKAVSTILINPLPAAISGTTTMCIGAASSLSDAGGGTWNSGSTSIATVGVSSGLVTGVSAGTTNVTYSLPTGCSISTPVVVNSLPIPYAMTGGGNYCSGGAGIHLGLSYSASGVSYQLMMSGTTPTPVGSPVIGSNSSLDFGLISTTGTYFAVATGSSGCTANMTGSKAVGVSPSPTVHNLTGGGGYCAGTTGVPIGLDLSDAGVKYQLFDGSSATGSAISGTGSSLSFGTFTSPGTYTIVGTNISSGCATSMSGVGNVTINPGVSVYNVSGSGGYCPGSTGVHVLLTNSDVGVNYQLYHNGVMVSPGGIQSGTGSGIDFGAFTDTGSYTIVGTDGTYGCIASMSGSATVTLLPLPSVYAVTGGGTFCSGTAGVHVGLTFGTSGIVYRLYGPSGLMDTVMGSGAGLDFGLQTAMGSYTVIGVNPSTGCYSNMTGAATVSESIAPNVYSVTGGGGICVGGAGVLVSLTGSDLGINYQLYRGSSPVGTPVSGSGGGFSFPASTTTGTYTVVGTSSSAPCVATMAGSATISSLPMPAAHSITGGGSYCNGGSGVHIAISGSDVGISYQLINGSSLEGSAELGTGSSVDFGSFTDAGTYLVAAINSSTGCTDTFGSTAVIINALPSTYNVTGGGSLCVGGTGWHIGLDNSNSGISYSLYRDGTTLVTTLSGSGSSLDYGLRTTAGTYTVTALNLLTGCTSLMSSSATINVNPLPTVYTLTGGGNYCSGGTGVDIALSNSDINIEYKLTNGSTVLVDTISAGGYLDFGNITTPGTYVVQASNSISHCIGNMAGSAIVNVVSPTVYTITGGGSFCAGGSGVHVILSGSNTSDSYTLQLDGSPVGSPVTGTGSRIDFGLLTAGGTYTAVATDNTLGCDTNMASSATVVVNSLPTVADVTGGGSFCAGTAGSHVGLDASSINVNYQLYNGFAPVGSAVAGTGSALDFGPQATSGTYKVVAVDALTSCADGMADSALVTSIPVPAAYRVNIENYGNYCAADSGLHVSLSSSQTGVNYTLYRDGTTMLGTTAGTGSALVLGLENIAGSYTVIASDGTCNNSMLGSVPLTIIPLPVVYTLTGGGAYCPSGDGVHIGIDGSQVGIYYQLYNTTTGAMVGTQYGTGSAVDFGLQTAAGTYVATGNSAVTTCPNNMYGSAAITIDTLPVPIISLHAYPGNGIGVWHIDSMKVFVSNDVGPHPTFQWSINGVAVAGATGQTFSNHQFFNNDVVSCAVTASGPCGGLTTTQSLVIQLYTNVGVSNVSSANNDVKLIPNPNNGTFTVKGTLGMVTDQDVTIEVTNMLGQLLYTNVVKTAGGVIDQQVVTNSLASGSYLLNVRTESGNEVFHFVIEK